MNPQPAAPSEPGQTGPDDPEPGERPPELGWPVGVVSERLAIAAPTLRSWDRRHGVGPSLRTRGNHRRYTELDIRRVLLMSRLTAQGVPAQSAADSVLTLDAAAIAERLEGDGVLEALSERGGSGRAPGAAGDATDGAVSVSVGDAAGSGQDATDLVEAIVGAARALDPRTMALLYRQVMRRRDVGRAWVDVFAPALRRVGALWEEGRLGVQSEHLTSELLQSELRAVVRANRLRVSGLPVVLASADDEQHHLPLLALEAELARHGVASLFLGPRVPSDALVSALRESQPRAVFLWASLARPQAEPFWRDLEVVDWPLEVVVGGPGWPDGIVVPEGPVSVTRVADFDAAVAALVPRPGGPER
ncbi:MerR family transcriptional regulator [Terrabacter sp. LjRoot27]|uniref:MerR family transcriptional regulator n=1 Tax=Terrabacter sp. LjRoot27 TaxID=3342306 RepID=UPI003ECC4B40